ncbi:MAG: hypothetical protein ACJASY_000932 [Halioglobus sp.]|jgi:hypothetical protein
MTSISRVFTTILTCCFLQACDSSNSRNESAPAVPGPYAADELWICKPGLTPNLCLDLDQTTTYIYSDTSFEVMEHVKAIDPEYDCFYVYPTVDFTEGLGNTEDLVNNERVLRPLYNQAARFTQLCDLYAPLYRQMTFDTFTLGADLFESEFYQTAFADVDEAFSQYLLESGDRPFVLIGHSQGSHMLIELMKRRFDNDPQLRERMISALLLGPVGFLQVPEGQLVGGSFENIPLCTLGTDTGCIVAFDSIVAGDVANRELVDQPRPCVNPTMLGGTPGILENVLTSATEFPLPEFVTTPWAFYPNLHTAACESDGFMGISTVENPQATPPATPQIVQLILGGTLHTADVNYAMGDLLRIVATQAESAL